jgi:hypothetical protein
VDAGEVGDLVIIAAVWVNPAAGSAELVCTNNRTATREALRAAVWGRPAVADVLAARDSARNPFYDPGRAYDAEEPHDAEEPYDAKEPYDAEPSGLERSADPEVA